MEILFRMYIIQIKDHKNEDFTKGDTVGGLIAEITHLVRNLQDS